MVQSPAREAGGQEPDAPAIMPEPPYYAVVFTSLRRAEEPEEESAAYARTAAEMERLARSQPGFLGIESVRDGRGVGITVSYWSSLEAIDGWRKHGDHRMAKRAGRAGWYAAYTLRICRVETVSTFHASERTSR